MHLTTYYNTHGGGHCGYVLVITVLGMFHTSDWRLWSGLHCAQTCTDLVESIRQTIQAVVCWCEIVSLVGLLRGVVPCFVGLRKAAGVLSVA